jgi:hypothetical protein
MDDWRTTLAKEFRERDNRPYEGVVLGTVISAPPNLQVSHPNGFVLGSGDLVVAAHLLEGYSRLLEMDEEGTTTLLQVGLPEQASVDYEIKAFELQLKTADTLEVGDIVIMIPTSDGQIYAVIDKAVVI